MKVHLRSRNDGKRALSGEELKLVKEFSRWVMARFISKRVMKNLELTIRFDSKLYERDGSYGLAIWEDKHYMGREFTMDVDTSFPFLSIIHTIAHELVHVKQWTLGEYHPDMRGDDIYFFMNEKFDAKTMSYWDLPWEIEAHGRAMGLVIRWIDALHKGEHWARKKITY